MEVIDRIKKNPFSGFLIKAFFFYIIWQLVYDLLIYPDGRLDDFLALTTVFFSKNILNALGWAVYTHERLIWIEGTQGLEIVNGCNALKLMVLYSGFIICLGNGLGEKLKFLTFGIVTIYMLNTIRIVLFNLVILYFKDYWNIIHEFSPFIFFYPFILWVWYRWTLVGIKNRDIHSLYESSLS